jgi:hypothetical protein
MRSYIKIFGPPVVKSIEALEKIAIDMDQLCIMDTMIMMAQPYGDVDSGSSGIGPLAMVPEERCKTLISKSGEALGEYDFFFEWFKNPSPKELNSLIQKIDEALAPLGCSYTITTKNR